ncbi:MAG: flagellar brake protein [Sterolibacterium sp.]|nr:flagellar brake protein [Sterolibacterium sp.]
MAENELVEDDRIRKIRLEVEELKRLMSLEVAVQKKAVYVKAIEQRAAILAPYDELRNAKLRESEEQRKAMLKEAEEQRRAMLRIELAQTDEENGEYFVHSRVQIMAFLRAMMNTNETVTIYFNDGNDFIITSISVVAEEQNVIVMQAGPNKGTNRQAMLSDKLVCISRLDKIKIQFVLRGVKMAQVKGRESFVAEIPERVLRLQRRENFRLTVPIRQPVKCVIPLPPPGDQTEAQPEAQTGSQVDGQGAQVEGQPEVEQEAVEVNVVDISGGGIGIVMPSEDVPFAPDMQFEKCQIELPTVGNITVTLRVRSTFEVSVRDGPPSKRAGCQFVNLHPAMLSVLQRYIIKEERERKAREAGMAKIK